MAQPVEPEADDNVAAPSPGTSPGSHSGRVDLSRPGNDRYVSLIDGLASLCTFRRQEASDSDGTSSSSGALEGEEKKGSFAAPATRRRDPSPGMVSSGRAWWKSGRLGRSRRRQKKHVGKVSGSTQSKNVSYHRDLQQ